MNDSNDILDTISTMNYRLQKMNRTLNIVSENIETMLRHVEALIQLMTDTTDDEYKEL